MKKIEKGKKETNFLKRKLWTEKTATEKEMKIILAYMEEE